MQIYFTPPPGLAVLALLGGVFFIALTATESAAEEGQRTKVAPRVARWESTIKNFEALDARTPPPRDAVLLVGGSNARRWANVDESFPNHRIINRGFGGARLTEILHFADRIVVPYSPKVIVVNAGGNDLNAGSTPAQVRETAESFITAVRVKLPKTQIYFLGLPYVRRTNTNPEGRALIGKFNLEFAKLAEKEPKVMFIDLAPAFLDDRGNFRPELFVEDGTHFSHTGYALVAGLLRDKL